MATGPGPSVVHSERLRPASRLEIRRNRVWRVTSNREKAPLSDVAISIGVLRHELGMTSTPSDLELIRCSPINGCGQLKPRGAVAIVTKTLPAAAREGYAPIQYGCYRPMLRLCHHFRQHQRAEPCASPSAQRGRSSVGRSPACPFAVIAERSPLGIYLGMQPRFDWRSTIGNNSHMFNLAPCAICPLPPPMCHCALSPGVTRCATPPRWPVWVPHR